jgi:hypothetical protein
VPAGSCEGGADPTARGPDGVTATDMSKVVVPSGLYAPDNMKENSLMPALVARKDNASPAFADAQVGIPPGFPSLAMVAALVIIYHLFPQPFSFQPYHARPPCHVFHKRTHAARGPEAYSSAGGG